MKNITNEQYQQLTKKATPGTKPVTIVKAFVIGGGICLIGQAINDWLKSFNLDVQTSAAIVTVCMIFLGALLTALNIYDSIAKHAGAGSIVPITGFANSIVSPAMEYKNEGYILGVGAKMFTVAGPVIVYGVITSVAIGILKLFFSI